MRALSNKFVNDLSEGILAPLIEMVKSDRSLCLELRGSYVSIYYRGGNLFKVDTAGAAGNYTIYFDPKYFKFGESVELPSSDIRYTNDVKRWLSASPFLKRAMDNYFAKIQWDEREFQQSMLRDNNFGSIARSTDFYICDIEYRIQSRHQFDLVAVHWPSVPHVRQHHPDNRRLVFLEAKHGDDALSEGSGLHAHIRHINDYASVPENLKRTKEEMVHVLNQKRALGLVECDKDLEGFSDDCPILILALINHDPGKSKLRDLLRTLPDSPNIELRIATASFLGYGLYDQGVHPLDEIWERFSDYVYHKT